MARDVSDTTPIESRDELVRWFEQGQKPKPSFRVGTEHEKVPFYRAGNRPVPYHAEPGERGGIADLLDGLAKHSGWERIVEADKTIGLFDPAAGGAISLEPGGQFELSGAPLSTVHETADELADHLAAVKAIAEPLGIGFLTLGMSPKWTLAETPVMPKGRYRIMANYMPKVGTRGLDMMFRTATVQANLDFADEADMVRKLRVTVALQPVVAALFANSPFTDGKPNGLLSARSEVWRDTDNARAGMLPFAFEDGFGFERYVDYALDVPMYFVKRGDTYHDVAGSSFRDLLAGKLEALPGEQARLSDWANHLSTIFPEVRLKRYLEMRGEDVGPPPMIVALSGLFVGLLYDTTALDSAWDLVRAWTAAERQSLRDAVPREGLAANIGGRSVAHIARELVSIAAAGLTARARRDSRGRDETYVLDPLRMILAKERTQADDLLALFKDAWRGNLAPVFETCTF